VDLVDSSGNTSNVGTGLDGSLDRNDWVQLTLDDMVSVPDVAGLDITYTRAGFGAIDDDISIRFDNLDADGATLVPTPSSLAMGVVAFGALALRRRRQV